MFPAFHEKMEKLSVSVAGNMAAARGWLVRATSLMMKPASAPSRPFPKRQKNRPKALSGVQILIDLTSAGAVCRSKRGVAVLVQVDKKRKRSRGKFTCVCWFAAILKGALARVEGVQRTGFLTKEKFVAG